MFPMLGPPRDRWRRKNRSKSKEREKKDSEGQLTNDPKQLSNKSYSVPQQKSRLNQSSGSGRIVDLEKIEGLPRETQENLGSHLNDNPSQDQPSKNIKKNPDSLIVISFITRGSNFSSRAQGTELLFYKPKTGLTQLNQSNGPSSSCLKKIQKSSESKTPWTFLFIEAGSLKEDDPNKLSKRSIDKILSPPDSKLIKIRSSKPLRWNSSTTLISIMYKVVVNEDNNHNSNKKKNSNSNSKGSFDWIKMGTESFYWSKIAGFHSAIENNLVSTALAAVFFPVALNVGYQELCQQDSLGRSDMITLKVLEILCLCVQAGYARDGFRFYPTNAKPLRPEGNLDRDFKLRIWSYWTEVICWHLIRCKPTFQVSVSHSLNKILAVVKPAVRDEKINVEGLEKLMVETIAQEADRSRSSIDNLVDEGLNEVFRRSSNSASNQPLHIFTLGSSSATYGILYNLVKYYLNRAKWKALPTSEKNMSTLFITITEGRPFHEGVILATKLNELIKAHQPNLFTRSRLDQKKENKSVNNKYSLNEFDKDIRDFYLDPNHQRILEKFDDDRSAEVYKPVEVVGLGELGGDDEKTLKRSGRLDDLLESFNGGHSNRFNDGSVEDVNFMIEVTSEAAIWTSLMNCQSNGILLLAADRILPNGNAVCKLGSASAAFIANSLNISVIVLCRTDRIHKFEDERKDQEGGGTSKIFSEDGEENNLKVLRTNILKSWKTLFKNEFIDELEKKVSIFDNSYGDCSKGKSKGFYFGSVFEEVKMELISDYVTDTGTFGIERVLDISLTLEDLNQLIWEDDEMV